MVSGKISLAAFSPSAYVPRQSLSARTKFSITNLGAEEFRWRVDVRIVRRDVDITINIVLRDSFGYSFSSLDMDIFI